jgi:hypothetical protein
VLKADGLLLERRSGKANKPRRDGRIAVDPRNTRWCSSLNDPKVPPQSQATGTRTGKPAWPIRQA